MFKGTWKGKIKKKVHPVGASCARPQLEKSLWASTARPYDVQCIKKRRSSADERPSKDLFRNYTNSKVFKALFKVALGLIDFDNNSIFGL